MSRALKRSVTVYDNDDNTVIVNYWVSYEQGEADKIPVVVIDPYPESVDPSDVHTAIKKEEGNNTFFE
jgi:hypothetical protein